MGFKQADSEGFESDQKWGNGEKHHKDGHERFTPCFSRSSFN